MIQKINYDLIMQQIIKGLNHKPKLLLHSCCAPCSSSVIERLREYFDVTVYYYNPNVYPTEEYEIRKTEQKNYLEKIDIPFIEGEYSKLDFYDSVLGLENELEGGKRCYSCYKFRMKSCAKKAKDLNFEYFCTTLSVSPHKNSTYINEIGKNLEEEYNIKFLFSDFKKRQGFLRSLALSKENNFYRQNYCGCEYSMNTTKKENLN
ncbi:MAG: epoxyqueuosine reductase QueH [Clostridia bacterium]|nr:epoxyqueuosine reductase QueH [Clostridia bacterium]